MAHLRLGSVFAALSLAIASVMVVAPNAAAQVTAPSTDHVACHPYNGWVIFHNSLGDHCFANDGKYVWRGGFSDNNSMCAGNNRGSFQWDAADGRNFVTTFEPWQCLPMNTVDRVYVIEITGR